ncbi:acetate--CoA ligase family protein [Chloroflexota bacterium]
MGKKIVEQLDPIFMPGSIAVIGASSVPTKWGYRKLSQPINSGFNGPIYPVNPNETEILGLKVYPTVLDIPGEVDLAVIAIPAKVVPKVMQQCVQKGVKGAIIISGGFAETNDEGKAIQDEVVTIAKKGNIRFVGPNVTGVWSGSSDLSLSTHQMLTMGNISFISQSGTFGAHLVSRAVEKGYGLSKFISMGNQADITVTDYMEYLGEDEDTRAIAIYLEGLADGRRFFEVASEVIREKPILVHKAGYTAAGARAAQSHTAALAGSDEIFDAMCKQVGIIQVADTYHIFDIAEALVQAPLPKGNRVAIIGTGGQGVVATDACTALGLEVPEFDDETKAMLKSYLPDHAPTPKNPLDWAGGVRTVIEEAEVVLKIAELDYIDAIISRPPLTGFDKDSPEEQEITGPQSANMMVEIPSKLGKPLIVMRPQSTGEVIQDILRQHHIPSFDSPEECARAMRALASYAETLRRLKED